MSRPLKTLIQSGAAAWDATINDNLCILFEQSIPLPEYVDFATLTADRPPAQNEGCVAAVSTPTWLAYFCDGTTWAPLGGGSINVFAYAGTEPTALEMDAALPVIDTFGMFKKGDTDPTFLVFRRSTAAGGADDDFSAVELTGPEGGGGLDPSGRFIGNVVTTSSDVGAALVGTLYRVDASGAPRTVTAPSAPSMAQRFAVKKVDATINTVTVDTPGAELIDGSPTSVLAGQWTAIEFVWDGASWNRM